MRPLLEKSRKLKILFTSYETFPPFRSEIKVLMAKEMVKRGHRIDFILQSSLPIERMYETTWDGCRVDVGMTVSGLSIGARLKKAWLGIINDCKIFQNCKNVRYDIVIVKNKFVAALFAIIGGRLYGSKVIYWSSYPVPEATIERSKTMKGVRAWLVFAKGIIQKCVLYNIIIKLVDHGVVQSEQMKRDMVKRGGDALKLTPVPMGVDIRKIAFVNRKNRKSILNSENKIVYLGTLARVRRIDFIVRVFSLVQKEHKKTCLILVGEGECESDIDDIVYEAKRLGVSDKVIITGFLPQQKAWEYVNMADVCVSPFYPSFILRSTSPTKLIEYMAMGKPVVGNSHPEQTKVIEESRGGLCVKWEEKAFAEAISYILSHPEESAEMGARGRKYVNRFRSYKRIAAMLECVLIKVIER